jgi:hypothetical protein
MSKLRMLSTGILLISVLSTSSYAVANQQPVNELAKYSLPAMVGGYEVLTILTSDNTACMMTGEKRLVLRATQPDVEDFLKDSRPEAIKLELEQHGLTAVARWGIEIVGPAVTLDEFLSNNQKWNNQSTSCPKLRPLETGSDWTEIKLGSGSFGYAQFEDTDAGSFTDDNAQAVNLVAPSSIGNNQNLYSAFLNNVKTNTGYFLQNGLLFQSGSGKVVWTDDSHGLGAQTYNISYIGGHTYWVTITYTNGSWWMCARDNANPSSYTCAQEPNGTGNNLGADLNTAIWTENGNTNSNWYQGFSSPLQAWGAKIYRNQVAQNWSTQHRHTADSCSTSWPPTNALNGSLTGGSTGNFTLSGVPLHC